MRISDWSSDVCSSDLWHTLGMPGPPRRRRQIEGDRRPCHQSVRSELSPVNGSGSSPVCFRSCCCRSEEHTSELQSLMRISYAVFCLKKKKNDTQSTKTKRQDMKK